MSQPSLWGIPVIEEPSIAEDTVLIVGSCDCKHNVITHGTHGCKFAGCDCTTPLARLVVVISSTREEQP